MRSLLIMVAAATASLHAGASEKVWTPSEMQKVKNISDVQISPSNNEVLFVTSELIVKEEKNTYISIIRKKNLLTEELSTISEIDETSMHPRWSPDGKWIAFLKESKKAKNLYLVSAIGGEAKALTDGTSSVQTFVWSPDSSKIAFVREDTTEAEKNRTKTSDAYIYKALAKINRLWMVDISSLETFSLTTDEYCVRGEGDFGSANIDFDWSPDASKITFAYSPDLGYDYFHLDSSIATIDLSSRTITPWEKKAPLESHPRYSPDGKWIAYLSNDSAKRYSIDRRVAIRSTQDGKERLLAETFNGGPYLVGPSIVGWTPNGKEVLFFEPKETRFHLVAIPINGDAAYSIDTGDTFFKAPTLSPDKKRLGFIAESFSTPPEAYISSINPFKPHKISSINEGFIVPFKTERMKWKSSDGTSIEGLVTYPKGYESGKKYPTLLVVHGGPMGFFCEEFIGDADLYPTAAFAESGFVVLRPNPRGSTGYGKDFRWGNYSDWGGRDYEDIMSGIDTLINKGIADPERLGVMGWSFGGFMTGWIVTQTPRFKAASLGAGLCNLVSMIGTTDLHRFMDDYFGSYLSNTDLYMQRSSINHVNQIQSECLIQHGTSDKRVPCSQSFELYHAMKNAGKDPTLVLYPEMSHHITDPDMILDCMQVNLEWFQKHLLQSP